MFFPTSAGPLVPCHTIMQFRFFFEIAFGCGRARVNPQKLGKNISYFSLSWLLANVFFQLLGVHSCPATLKCDFKQKKRNSRNSIPKRGHFGYHHQDQHPSIIPPKVVIFDTIIRNRINRSWNSELWKLWEPPPPGPQIGPKRLQKIVNIASEDQICVFWL